MSRADLMEGMLRGKFASKKSLYQRNMSEAGIILCVRFCILSAEHYM